MWVGCLPFKRTYLFEISLYPTINFNSTFSKDTKSKEMGYFSLRCFDPQVGKYIIIVLDVIVGILGITHWGCKNRSY